MFKKRKVRRITFKLTNDISIEVNAYALIRPALPGRIHSCYDVFVVVTQYGSHDTVDLINLFPNALLSLLGRITWLDSVTNLPLKVRFPPFISFCLPVCICSH